MPLGSLIDEVPAPDQTITLVNPRGPELYEELLASFFEPMSVDVATATLDADQPADTVLLHEGDEPVAVSPLDAVYRSALGVNVDRYATADRGLESIETPDVIAALSAVRIPGDRENKYVLTQVSRHVEAMAYKTAAGELHAAFQRLSRLTSERGTRRVYERLSDTDLDVHVYGVPDAAPALPVTVHGRDDGELRDAWFVVHDGDGNDGWKGALVAEAVAPNTYLGFWTFDPGTVDDVLAYVTATYPESS